MDWFLYDRGLRHERIKPLHGKCIVVLYDFLKDDKEKIMNCLRVSGITEAVSDTKNIAESERESSFREDWSFIVFYWDIFYFYLQILNLLSKIWKIQNLFNFHP